MSETAQGLIEALPEEVEALRLKYQEVRRVCGRVVPSYEEMAVLHEYLTQISEKTVRQIRDICEHIGIITPLVHCAAYTFTHYYEPDGIGVRVTISGGMSGDNTIYSRGVANQITESFEEEMDRVPLPSLETARIVEEPDKWLLPLLVRQETIMGRLPSHLTLEALNDDSGEDGFDE